MQVKNDEAAARKSLAWYRRQKPDNSSLDAEMNELREEWQYVLAKHGTPFTLKKLFGKQNRKPFFIAMFLQVGNEFRFLFCFYLAFGYCDFGNYKKSPQIVG